MVLAAKRDGSDRTFDRIVVAANRRADCPKGVTQTNNGNAGVAAMATARRAKARGSDLL